MNTSRSQSLFVLILTGLLSACGAASTHVSHPSHSRHTHNEGDTRSTMETYGAIMFWFYPNFSLRVPAQTGFEATEWGWSWEFPFLVGEGDYRHGGAISLGQFFDADLVSFHGVYHFRVASAPSDDPVVHFLLGAGVFGESVDEVFDERFGFGPRGEFRLQCGQLRSAQVLLLTAWEGEVETQVSTFELSVGLTMPLQF